MDRHKSAKLFMLLNCLVACSSVTMPNDGMALDRDAAAEVASPDVTALDIRSTVSGIIAVTFPDYSTNTVGAWFYDVPSAERIVTDSLVSGPCGFQRMEGLHGADEGAIAISLGGQRIGLMQFASSGQYDSPLPARDLVGEGVSFEMLQGPLFGLSGHIIFPPRPSVLTPAASASMIQLSRSQPTSFRWTPFVGQFRIYYSGFTDPYIYARMVCFADGMAGQFDLSPEMVQRVAQIPGSATIRLAGYSAQLLQARGFPMFFAAESVAALLRVQIVD